MTRRWHEVGSLTQTDRVNEVGHVGHEQMGRHHTFVDYVCDTCGRPAERRPITSGETHGEQVRLQPVDESNVSAEYRTASRWIDVTIFACDEHYDALLESVLDEYGWATNMDDMQRQVPTFVPRDEA